MIEVESEKLYWGFSVLAILFAGRILQANTMERRFACRAVALA